MKYLKNIVFILSLLMSLLSTSALHADLYLIDTVGSHASVNFKIKHLGYSWLTGRFDKFKGTFSYDEKHPEKSSIGITVQTSSINSAHALRDKHLRGNKFLNIKKYPIAKFTSDSYQPTGKNSGIVGVLKGKLSLHGVTRTVSMNIKQVGAGADPWGGFRRGFETSLTIRLHDYGIKHDLGSASEELELTIYIEGIKDDSVDDTNQN